MYILDVFVTMSDVIAPLKKILDEEEHIHGKKRNFSSKQEYITTKSDVDSPTLFKVGNASTDSDKNGETFEC